MKILLLISTLLLTACGAEQTLHHEPNNEWTIVGKSFQKQDDVPVYYYTVREKVEGVYFTFHLVTNKNWDVGEKLTMEAKKP